MITLTANYRPHVKVGTSEVVTVVPTEASGAAAALTVAPISTGTPAASLTAVAGVVPPFSYANGSQNTPVWVRTKHGSFRVDPDVVDEKLKTFNTTVSTGIKVRAGATKVATVLVNVATGGTGLVKLHNCAAAADIAAGNLLASIDATATGFREYDGIQFPVGLCVVVVGATTDVSITYAAA